LTALKSLKAHLAANCRYVRNEGGTAPGMWFVENGAGWMAMLGVPHESIKLMTDFVIIDLKKRFDLKVIYHRVHKKVDIGECWLASLISEWEKSLPEHIKLSYLPSLGEVKLRLTAIGRDDAQMASGVVEQIEKVLPLISQYLDGLDKESLPEVIGKLLKNKNKTLALAESCSGGYISHLITGIAGSSSYFNGSIV